MGKRIVKLAVAIGVCEMAGLVGSIFTLSAIPTWYASLVKPAFSPPNWVFGPVWTTLYAFMGVSLYLVWVNRSSKKTPDRKKGIGLFFIQLVLNTLWSIIFFGLRSPILALIEIVVLWVVLALTVKQFSIISKLAAYLLLPYLVWVTFAGYLNYQIWLLNR